MTGCLRSGSSNDPRMTMQRRALVSIIALHFAGLSSLLAPVSALAQKSGALAAPAEGVTLAEGYAAEAFEAYRIRNYGQALSLYERALAAAPSADILYNIARVYDVGLRDRRLALDYYERYLADSKAAPERRVLVRQRLEELRAAERAIRSINPDDIDAIAREFPVDEPETAPTPPPVAAARSDAGLRPLELGAVALGAAGLSGVGLGVGFGLSARSRTDAWQKDCTGNECSSQRAVDAAHAAARRARVATISFAAGGSLLAIGAVLWWIDTGPDEPGISATLRFVPLADGSGVGGGVSGSF